MEIADWSLNSLVPLKTFVNRRVWGGQGPTTGLSLFVTQPCTVCQRQWVRDEKRLVLSGYPGLRGCEDMMSPREGWMHSGKQSLAYFGTIPRTRLFQGELISSATWGDEKKKAFREENKKNLPRRRCWNGPFYIPFQRKVFLRLLDLVTMLPFSPFNTLMYPGGY